MQSAAYKSIHTDDTQLLLVGFEIQNMWNSGKRLILTPSCAPHPTHSNMCLAVLKGPDSGFISNTFLVRT